MARFPLTRRAFIASSSLVAASTASAQQHVLPNGIYLVVDEGRDDATSVPYRERNDYEVVRNGRLMAFNIASAHADYDENIGLPTVLIVLTDAGREQFSRITAKYTGARLAVIIDGFVMTAPTIVEPIRGGQLQISGSFTPDEAADLARHLTQMAARP